MTWKESISNKLKQGRRSMTDPRQSKIFLIGCCQKKYSNYTTFAEPSGACSFGSISLCVSIRGLLTHLFLTDIISTFWAIFTQAFGLSVFYPSTDRWKIDSNSVLSTNRCEQMIIRLHLCPFSSKVLNRTANIQIRWNIKDSVCLHPFRLCLFLVKKYFLFLHLSQTQPPLLYGRSDVIGLLVPLNPTAIRSTGYILF